LIFFLIRLIMLNNMAEKKKKGKWYGGLKEETRYSISGIISLGLSLFFILALFNKAGLAGHYVNSALEFLFGQALFLVPSLCFFAAIVFFSSFRPNLLASSLIGGFLILISGLALSDIIFTGKAGGYIGFFAALPFLKLVDFWASLILFSVFFIVGFLVMFNVPLSFSFLTKKLKQPSLFSGSEDAQKISESLKENLEEIKEEANAAADKGAIEKESYDEEKSFSNSLDKGGVLKKSVGRKFQPPPLDLLESDKGKPSAGDIKANANIIKRTFQNFGISVEMAEVRIGPSITQYALKPAEGVKLSRITALNNDLALVLAAHPIRIEAPIPGRSLVGIEVPNRSASLVGLRLLIGQEEFQNSDKPLTLALGRNVAGRPVYASISKMPHLLIAGATGSGKSVAIHSILISLLYRHGPRELKLLLIDPKRVEMSIYNDLPYLLSPVITEAKKAIMALKWVTGEMERRYETLLAAGAKDIDSYHKKNPSESMPYLIVVIDELADIMAAYPREFEASIVRLAQMSRAVGIHLVVSTQRPSVEVITGLIKANITTRMAFQVASQVDSRTILDMAGAEKLLGNGDMLFLSNESSKPRRIQGSFVSDKEVKKVVDYLVDEYEGLTSSDLGLSNGEVEQSSIFDRVNESDEEDDALYEDARELVIQAGKASSSYLQRRLRVGYARAARLLDLLEERRVVGPQDGSRPRDVLVERPSESR